MALHRICLFYQDYCRSSKILIQLVVALISRSISMEDDKNKRLSDVSEQISFVLSSKASHCSKGLVIMLHAASCKLRVQVPANSGVRHIRTPQPV